MFSILGYICIDILNELCCSMKTTLFLIVIVLTLFSCSPKVDSPVLVNAENFNAEVEGRQVGLFTLKNANGLVTQITNYGGRVVTLWVPDKQGNFADIVLGYDSYEGYINAKESYFGALIGRYGNRIGNAKFTLNGTTYTLAANNGENALHGGQKGFNDVIWDAEQPDGQTLVLKYLSSDMEEGYPGNLSIKVQYKLTNDNELKIEYWATTDKPTPVNLTHHSYFNLKGAGNETILDHEVQINADHFTPVNQGLIPTGEIAKVEGTPMDFKDPTEVGSRLEEDFEQLKFGLGYDHNWVLNLNSTGLTFAAKASEPKTGRVLEVYTNEPGIQFYIGNFLDGTEIGKNMMPYKYRSAFCFETQHFPDSPNQENFPSTILNPGEEYYSICIYKFGLEE